MKTLLTALFALTGLFCFAQWETVNGNGNMKKETRQASGYTAVSSLGSFDVHLSYGNSNSITIEADENLLPYIETTVEKGTLTIRPKKNVGLKSKNKMTVQVSLTKLTALKLAGSGNITGNGQFSNNGKTEISLAGSGNIEVGVDRISELSTTVAGSGNIEVKGSGCDNVSAAVTGSGNIDCSAIPGNDAFVQISGSGNVKVYANKTIDAKVSGSGNVYYKGAASKLNSKTSGSGKITRI